MKRFHLAALAAALSIGAPWAALATSPEPGPEEPPMPGHRLARIDTNGDATIDRDEARQAPRLAAEFDALDTDRNGLLDKAELRKGHERRGPGPHRHERAEERFDDSDTNGDGAIDLAEAKAAAQARAERMFGKMDADGDGKVTPDEMKRYAPPPPPLPPPPPPKR